MPMDTIDYDREALGGFVDADENVGPDIICGGQATGQNGTDEQYDRSEIAHRDLPGPAFSPHLRLTMPYCGSICKAAPAIGALAGTKRACCGVRYAVVIGCSADMTQQD